MNDEWTKTNYWTGETRLRLAPFGVDLAKNHRGPTPRPAGRPVSKPRGPQKPRYATKAARVRRRARRVKRGF